MGTNFEMTPKNYVMKNVSMHKFVLAIGLLVGAQTIANAGVDLRITYNNQAVCRYEITVKAGGVTIGKGLTNDNGDVSISNSSVVNEVDVFGYKKTANGEKKFDIQGYVKLDDKGFAHIKMEELVKQMAEDSGFPESMMAAAWGLTDLDCGVKSNSQKSETKPQANKEESKTEESDHGFETTTEEGDEDGDSNVSVSKETLLVQEQSLKSDIASLDRKIEKQGAEIKKLKAAAADERQIKVMEFELEEMKLKRERKTLALERNQKKQKAPLTAAEAKVYDDREKSYKSREDDLKESRKELETQLKEEKKSVKSEQKAEGGNRKSDEAIDLAKLNLEIAGLKTDISMKETALARVRKKPDTSKEEIDRREAELNKLREKLKDAEERRDGQKK